MRLIAPGTCLFVYGTLMSASKVPVGYRQRQRLYREARYLGAATVRGRLYNFGSYPALMDGDDGDGTVHGEVLLLTYPKATFGWLDSFEAPDYARVERAVRLASGQSREAWVYLYRGPNCAARAIASGRWRPQVSRQ